MSMTPAFAALVVDDLVPSRARAELELRLKDTLLCGGIALVTGEAGAGKTAAVRAFVRALDSRAYVTVALVPPLENPRALLRATLSALGEVPEWACPDALSQLCRLVMPWHEQGRILLVVIDEAQDLPTPVILFLRSLLQTPLGDRVPLRIILVGTPALSARLKVQAMEPIVQRITSRAQLLGFTRDETEGYLTREAQAVNLTFAPDAVELIFQRSRAVPRVVTTLGRLSSTVAARHHLTEVTVMHVQDALEEIQLR